MKKIFLFLLISIFAVSVICDANAQTKVEIGLAGDTYYATDNDQGRGLEERPLQNTNIFRNRFGTNNVLLHANASNKDWKTNFALITYSKDPRYGESTSVDIEDANIALHLFEGLWITGGLFAIWDVDYTFDRWFTGNSLTDYRNMAGPYMAYGLEYVFNDDVTLGAGLMNSNAIGFLAKPDISKSIYAKFDLENFYNDWDFTLGWITGNQALWEATNSTEIYLTAGGTIVDKLEAKLSAKMFMDALDVDGSDTLNTITFQVLARYHFHKKFAAGVRFSFITSDIPNISSSFDNIVIKRDGITSGVDLGIVCEYNPVPYAYLRLEGGMISLSNSAHEDKIKMFSYDNKSSRLGVALSMGFKFGLFETEIK